MNEKKEKGWKGGGEWEGRMGVKGEIDSDLCSNVMLWMKHRFEGNLWASWNQDGRGRGTGIFGSVLSLFNWQKGWS